MKRKEYSQKNDRGLGQWREETLSRETKIKREIPSLVPEIHKFAANKYVDCRAPRLALASYGFRISENGTAAQDSSSEATLKTSA